MRRLFTRYPVVALATVTAALCQPGVWAQTAGITSANAESSGNTPAVVLLNGGKLTKSGVLGAYPHTLDYSGFPTEQAAMGGSTNYRFQALDFAGAAGNVVNDMTSALTPAVVGAYTFKPSVSDFTGYHGVQFVGPLTRPIDFPGAVGTSAEGVNSFDQIVGLYEDSAARLHGFLDIGGKFTAIDFPGATNTRAEGINDMGQIVGCYHCGIGPNTQGQGFLHSAGVFTTVSYPGAAQTFALGINRSAVIVGIWVDTGGKVHGFSDIGGTFASIDFPGASGTWANGVNDAGEIACYYFDTSGVEHGCLYSGGVFTTIDVPGASGTGLNKVNDHGQLAGFYVDSLGEFHGLFATPIW
jgi:uncharacterized membrane protein